jgi:hypothetical protein
LTGLTVTLTALVVGGLAAIAFGPELYNAVRRPARPASRPTRAPAWDPGRELRAERVARELLRSVVSEDEYEAYEQLGFLSVPGGVAADAGAGAHERYAYLVYPHRPIVAYDAATGEPLNEYCVTFSDRSEPALGERLPAADDVLAKWMALHGRERELIATANMHVPGRQVDPDQVRRDLVRLREWRAARARAAA